jgi:hypothetical protein
MSSMLMPFIWVAITLPCLYFLQRWIHRHLHGVALLLTGNKQWAIVLYAIVLFPGVLLHELSHWITANILRVKTGKFSVLPKSIADGSVQLGYVEYYKTSKVGPIRESLIGSAPLVTGTAVVILIAFKIFDVPTLSASIVSGDIELLTNALVDLFETPDFLIWLYLLFAISNAMMPSSSDRRAWPAFALIMVVFAIILYLLGLADNFVESLVGPAATVFGYLGLAYSLVIGVDIFFIFFVYIIESMISRIKGVDVVYGSPER